MTCAEFASMKGRDITDAEVSAATKHMLVCDACSKIVKQSLAKASAGTVLWGMAQADQYRRRKAYDRELE